MLPKITKNVNNHLRSYHTRKNNEQTAHLDKEKELIGRRQAQELSFPSAGGRADSNLFFTFKKQSRAGYHNTEQGRGAENQHSFYEERQRETGQAV